MPATESQLDAPPASRLVIRIKLMPQEPPPPARRRIGRSALLLIAGMVAVVLGWLAIDTLLESEPPPPLAARTEDVPVVIHSPPANPVASEVQLETPPPSPVNEVIPEVPQSALDTIRGTVRVSVRVTMDKRGAVVDATADDRGPSRYFERLAVEAAKKWTFTPTNSEERRTMLVRFNFTRAGASAHAS